MSLLRTSVFSVLLTVNFAQDYDYVSECPEENGIFADALQCDRYYECKDGEVTDNLCDDGLVFDETSHAFAKCSFPFSIDCTGRPDLQPAQPSPFCPRKNGYFADPDPAVCDVFYFCVDGRPNKITCPSGLIFDPTTGQCGWSDQTERKGCRSQDLYEFDCPNQDSQNVDHSRHPDPNDCGNFFLCIGGKPRKSKCSLGLVYKSETTSCERQETVEGPCNTWYNQTYLDDVLPKPLPRQPSNSLEGERRRRPQVQLQNPQFERRQNQREKVSAPLPPQLADLAQNSRLGPVDQVRPFQNTINDDFQDRERQTFLGSLRGKIGNVPVATTTRAPFTRPPRRQQSTRDQQPFRGQQQASRDQQQSSRDQQSFRGQQQSFRGQQPSRGQSPQASFEPEESDFSSFPALSDPAPSEPGTGFGRRRIPQGRVPSRAQASQDETSFGRGSSQEDSRLDLESLDSLGPSDLESFLTRSSPQTRPGSSQGSGASFNPRPIPAVPAISTSSSSSSSSSSSTGFGTRRRVPLSRGSVPRRAQETQTDSQPDAQDQLSDQRDTQNFRRTQIRRGSGGRRGSAPLRPEETGEEVGVLRRAPVGTRREQGSRRPPTSSIEEGDEEKDTPTFSRGPAPRRRLEISRPSNLPPLREFEEEETDFGRFSSTRQRSRGSQA